MQSLCKSLYRASPTLKTSAKILIERYANSNLFAS
jgi:hypothetical protein